MSDQLLRPPAVLADEVSLAHAIHIYDYDVLQRGVAKRQVCLVAARRIGDPEYIASCEHYLEYAQERLVNFHAKHADVLAFVTPDA